MDEITKKALKTRKSIFDKSLNNAFLRLTLNDFLNTKGMQQRKKASQTLKNYFDTFDTLEYFVKYDILQHSIALAQLHAFRQWMELADVMLATRNFEAFFIIVSSLSHPTVENLLKNHLGSEESTKFEAYKNLIDSKKNFAKFRRYVEHHRGNSAPLLFLLTRDLVKCDEVLEESRLTLPQTLGEEHPHFVTANRKKALLEDVIRCQKKRNKQTLSPVEKAMIRSIKKLHQEDKKREKLYQYSQASSKRLKALGFWDKRLRSNSGSREFEWTQSMKTPRGENDSQQSPRA